MEKSDKSARKALVKAWKESEHEKARAEFPLGDAVLSKFFADLEDLVGTHGCFHDTRHAQAVIDSLALVDASANALLDWCCEHGGFCDCEISANTFGHWLECRADT
jgi:Protein of unknown function (DUF2695)